MGNTRNNEIDLGKIYDSLNEKKGNLEELELTDDELKMAVEISIFIKDENKPGECQFSHLNDEQRKQAAILYANDTTLTVHQLGNAVGYQKPNTNTKPKM